MEIVLKKRQELKSLNEQVIKEYDAVGENTPTQEQKDRIADLNKKISDLSADVKYFEERENVTRSAKEYLDDFKPGARPDQGIKGLEAEQARKSAVQIIMADEAFKAWHKNGAYGNSPSVEIRGVKTLITGASDTSAGALVVSDRTNIVDTGTIKKQLGVLDLVTIGTTQSDTVEIVQVTSFTNNAAETLEAEADGDPSGAKPESAMAMAVVQFPVQNIPHWIPVTRRALADASQIETYINDLLLYGLRERLNSQIIAGNGTSPNLSGIADYGTITSQAYSVSLIETLLKGRTKVRTTGKGIPTAYLLNPADNEAILLATDAYDRYYFGGPNAYGVQTVWGLPVVEDETAAQGTGYVAQWNLAQLWVRENATIRVSESHSDYFTKNIVAILAEMRAAFGLVRPAAFVSMDLTA